MPRATLLGLPDELLLIILTYALSAPTPFHPFYKPYIPAETSCRPFDGRERQKHRDAWLVATGVSRRLRELGKPLFFATRWLVLPATATTTTTTPAPPPPPLLPPPFGAADAALAGACARDVVLAYASWPGDEAAGSLPPKAELAAALRRLPGCRRCVALADWTVHNGGSYIEDVEDPHGERPNTLAYSNFVGETHAFAVDEDEDADGGCRVLPVTTMVLWRVRHPAEYDAAIGFLDGYVCSFPDPSQFIPDFDFDIFLEDGDDYAEPFDFTTAAFGMSDPDGP